MKRFATVIAATAVLVLVGWGILHIVISPINPEQEPPSRHVDSACWACHVVLTSAEIIE